MVRTEMVKELARLGRDGSGDFTLRTWNNSYVFIRRGFSPWKAHLFIATRRKSHVHCHGQAIQVEWADGRGFGLEMEVGLPRPRPQTDHRCLSSLIRTSLTPSISRSALRCSAMPCCWFCGRRRAILPPLAFTSCSTADFSSNGLGRVIGESAIKAKKTALGLT